MVQEKAKGIEDMVTSQKPETSNPVLEKMLNKLSEITVAATPTVYTMDMGLEYDFITERGAGTSFGNLGEWPVYKFHPIAIEQWKMIREKIADHTITEQEFDGTDIRHTIRILHAIYGEDYEKCYGDVAVTFAGMLELPEILDAHFFCLLDVRAWKERPVFFAQERELKEAFCKAYCYDVKSWEDMSDDEIEMWAERMEDDLAGLAMCDYTDPECESVE